MFIRRAVAAKHPLSRFSSSMNGGAGLNMVDLLERGGVGAGGSHMDGADDEGNNHQDRRIPE